MGSILGRLVLKPLKMVPVATLLGTELYTASTGEIFLHVNLI